MLYLRYEEEHTEEIGQVFNISQQAVSKCICKILSKLNKLLMQRPLFYNPSYTYEVRVIIYISLLCGLKQNSTPSCTN